MTIEDEAKAILDQRRKNLWSKIIILVLVCFIVDGVIVLSVMDRQKQVDGGVFLNGPANVSVGNNSAVFLTGMFSLNQSYLSDLKYNRSLHIPENSTENWTIWKGNRVVAYIPK